MLRSHASQPARALPGRVRRFLLRSSASAACVFPRKGGRLLPAQARTWFFAFFTATSPVPRGTASARLPRSRHRGLHGFSWLLSLLNGVRDAVNAISPATPVRGPRRSAWQEARLRRKRPTPETGHPERNRSTEGRKPGTDLGGGR